MKVTFGTATLADVAASPKLCGVIEQLGGANTNDIVKAYNSGFEVKFPRGNVGGQFVFIAASSYASYSDAATAFKTAYALQNSQDTVIFTPMPGATTLTMASAICHQVQRVAWQGKRLDIRYTFEITTIT